MPRKETEEARSAIAEILRQARKKRGLSLRQVQKATGVSCSALSLLEHGYHDITFSRMVRLAEFYRIDLRDIADRVRLPESSARPPRLIGEPDYRAILGTLVEESKSTEYLRIVAAKRRIPYVEMIESSYCEILKRISACIVPQSKK